MQITTEEFLAFQPNCPEVAESDNYYITLANIIAKCLDKAKLLATIDETVRKRIVISTVAYFQDIIADAGIWRSFSAMCKKLYGKPLPIYETTDSYVEYELNLEDVQFIVWYVIEMSVADFGEISPFHKSILDASKLIFDILSKVYDDAPVPVELKMALDVDLNDLESDEESLGKVYETMQWLFKNSYLFPPAARDCLADLREREQDIIENNSGSKNVGSNLDMLNIDYMNSSVTGPLSLNIIDWLRLISNEDIPTERKTDSLTLHKDYAALCEAMGGDQLKFFGNYEDLNSFLNNEIKWRQNKDEYSLELKNSDNYVLFADKTKGLMITPNVAQFIKHPNNPLYDEAKAMGKGASMILQKGMTPIALLRHLFENDLVPDIRLTYDNTGKVLHDNWDFFARLYMQKHYYK